MSVGYDSNKSSMPLSPNSVGFIIWAISCTLAASFLLIYDGCYKQNINIISKLYASYLIIQSMASILKIINNELIHPPSNVINFIFYAIITCAANICALSQVFISSFPPNTTNYSKPLSVSYCLPSISYS